MIELENLKMTRLTRYHIGELARLHDAAFEAGWTERDFIENLQNEYDDILGLVEITESGLEIPRGFILIRTLDDQSEILTIVVDPAFARKGLGRALLKAGQRTAKRRGADIMFLEVAADNGAAEALYQKAGFQRCGTRKAYYRREKGRVDAHLYQKKLQ